MDDMVNIAVSRQVYERLQMLMVPPMGDLGAVIEGLLYQDGRASPAALALQADEQHYSLAEEFERARAGVYECGGCT